MTIIVNSQISRIVVKAQGIIYYELISIKTKVNKCQLLFICLAVIMEASLSDKSKREELFSIWVNLRNVPAQDELACAAAI